MEILNAIAQQLENGVSALQLLGDLDEPKLKSAAKLFEFVSRPSAGGPINTDAEVNAACKRVLTLIEEPLLPSTQPTPRSVTNGCGSPAKGDARDLGELAGYGKSCEDIILERVEESRVPDVIRKLKPKAPIPPSIYFGGCAFGSIFCEYSTLEQFIYHGWGRRESKAASFEIEFDGAGKLACFAMNRRQNVNMSF